LKLRLKWRTFHWVQWSPTNRRLSSITIPTASKQKQQLEVSQVKHGPGPNPTKPNLNIFRRKQIFFQLLALKNVKLTFKLNSKNHNMSFDTKTNALSLDLSLRRSLDHSEDTSHQISYWLVSNFHKHSISTKLKKIEPPFGKSNGF